MYVSWKLPAIFPRWITRMCNSYQWLSDGLHQILVVVNLWERRARNGREAFGGREFVRHPGSHGSTERRLTSGRKHEYIARRLVMWRLFESLMGPKCNDWPSRIEDIRKGNSWDQKPPDGILRPNRIIVKSMFYSRVATRTENLENLECHKIPRNREKSLILSKPFNLICLSSEKKSKWIIEMNYELLKFSNVLYKVDRIMQW